MYIKIVNHKINRKAVIKRTLNTRARRHSSKGTTNYNNRNQKEEQHKITIIWTTRTPIKIGSETKCSHGVSISCPIN